MAARALGAGLVISSGSMPQSITLARQSGAHYVFDYKRDNIAAEIAKLTSGRGGDLVFDATYSEMGFVETAKTIRREAAGPPIWPHGLVLGVGSRFFLHHSTWQGRGTQSGSAASALCR
jgi:NADPH:quinone reductase-like Zn-dependent oxidoreductase